MGDLIRRAKQAGKRLATLAVDTEVRFRSPTDRAAFSNELTETITKLISKYHDETAPGGRAHRLVVADTRSSGGRAPDRRGHRSQSRAVRARQPRVGGHSFGIGQEAGAAEKVRPSDSVPLSPVFRGDWWSWCTL